MKWRTPTVLAICHGIRAQQDWRSLPVLADALQEAGLDERLEFLKRMRTEDLPWFEAVRMVAYMTGGEPDAALTYMEDKANEMGEGGYPGWCGPMTAERLVAAARRYAETGDDGLGDGSMNWSNAVASRDEEDEFWRHYTALTALPAPAPDRRWGFLRCEC